MAQLTPKSSASRTVREYTGQHYLHAAGAYRARAADRSAVSRKLVDWRNALAPKWAALRFGAVTVETRGEQHLIAVDVFLKDANPDSVQVEPIANEASGGNTVRQEMMGTRPLLGEAGGNVYSAIVSATRPTTRTSRRESYRIAAALPCPWRLL
jgi:starch phosphorylase